MTVQVPMIDGDGVAAALPLAECIEAMSAALCALAAGRVVQPPRTVLRLPDGAGSLYTMPAFSADPHALTVKLITIFEGNGARELPTHQGLVVVFDPDTGTPALLLDAARLTAIRTAAVSAVATRLLARPDATELAILGTGVQARSHIEALCLVRPIRRIRIWGRTRARADALVSAARPVAGDHVRIEVCDSGAAAVQDADIICTATSARTPVLRGAWLSGAQHINAIGASTPDARELDSDVLAGARIYVDSVDAARAEAGDLLLAWQEGLIAGPDSWTELGSALADASAASPTGRTVFKSVGLAVEDAAAAALVARRTRAGDPQRSLPSTH